MPVPLPVGVAARTPPRVGEVGEVLLQLFHGGLPLMLWLLLMLVLLSYLPLL